MSILRSFLAALGSHASDIASFDSVDNPLPPCPDSPNCIRITKKIDGPINLVFEAVLKTIQSMKPEEMAASKNDYKIESVFKVFFFRDDIAVQLIERNSASTYLHIRSASRVGFTDLGVNSRRVKRFLKRLPHRF